MIYFHLKNHQDILAEKLEVHPSELRKPLPKFEGKAEMRDWCKRPGTEHVFFSTFEGVSPNNRVTGWDGANAPFKMHGVVGDYDGDVDLGLVKDAIRKYPERCNPTWLTKTWSGGMRAIWEFSEPILVDNATVGKGMLEEFSKRAGMHRLTADAEMDPKSLEPATYWELGTGWDRVAEPVGQEIIQSCFFNAAKTLLKGDHKTSSDIPIEIVAEEVSKRWPGRWTGAFEVGARGPLFWVNDGIDRVGCQVTADGMLCYSSRANTNFISWSDLLGYQFVRKYEEKKIGDVMNGIYFDGNLFWAKGTAGWVYHNKENINIILKSRGLSGRKVKGTSLTDIEQAQMVIFDANRIDAALPLIFNKREVATIAGKRYLNTSSLKAMDPLPCTDVYGRCPWLSAFFDNFFDPVPASDGLPRDYFLAWWKRAYVSARENENGMAQGHGIVIAGAQHTGKTFLSHVILGKSFGGAVADASAALSNPGAFNKEMGESAIWAIDDNLGATNFETHRKSTEMFKRTIANPYVLYHAKHKDAQTIPWCGRVVHTTNLDAESFRSVPDSEGSIMDKVMYFMCNTNGWRPDFSTSNQKNESRVAAELPYFLGWLSEWEPPASIVDHINVRYGIKSYHHPFMLREVQNSNPDHRFAEVLDLWKQRYRDENPNTLEWEGSAASLKASIEGYPDMRGLMHRYDVIAVGRLLSKLLNDNTIYVQGIKKYKIQLTPEINEV